jgi:Transglycosylase SLT domain
MPGRWDDIITKHANRVGISPDWMKHIMSIESGGDPRNTTGSYHGLFQLSQSEFSKHGGTGDIHDPEQNTMAAANKLARESKNFKERYGRDPKLVDLYMQHQQGEAGYAAHLSAPDAPAWKNMLMTGEGQQKGERWAKAAIWGNMPASDKARFGSVENVTSKDFVNAWGDRIEGGRPDYGGPTGEVKEAKATSPKISWLTGKPLPESKPTFMGMDFEVPQPRIDLQVPQFTPKFTTA